MCLNDVRTTSMFKQYTYMNDIYVYSKRTYEKYISHDYYCQIMAHEVCDLKLFIVCWHVASLCLHSYMKWEIHVENNMQSSMVWVALLL